MCITKNFLLPNSPLNQSLAASRLANLTALIGSYNPGANVYGDNSLVATGALDFGACFGRQGNDVDLVASSSSSSGSSIPPVGCQAEISGCAVYPAASSIPVEPYALAPATVAAGSSVASVAPIQDVSSQEGAQDVPKKKRRRKIQKPGLTAKCQERHFVKHNYHDYSKDDVKATVAALSASTEPDNTKSEATAVPTPAPSRRGGPAMSFPYKLHTMLANTDRGGYSHIVTWRPHGRCFVIHDTKLFASEILPVYFHLNKITSFQRQLNLYGFARLTRGPDAGGYYHELFLRGKEFLCARIQRMKVKGTGYKAASNPNDEPDFYSLPPVVYDHEEQAQQEICMTEISQDDDMGGKRNNPPVQMLPEPAVLSEPREVADWQGFPWFVSAPGAATPHNFSLERPTIPTIVVNSSPTNPPDYGILGSVLTFQYQDPQLVVPVPPNLVAAVSSEQMPLPNAALTSVQATPARHPGKSLFALSSGPMNAAAAKRITLNTASSVVSDDSSQTSSPSTHEGHVVGSMKNASDEDELEKAILQENFSDVDFYWDTNYEGAFDNQGTVVEPPLAYGFDDHFLGEFLLGLLK